MQNRCLCSYKLRLSDSEDWQEICELVRNRVRWSVCLSAHFYFLNLSWDLPNYQYEYERYIQKGQFARSITDDSITDDSIYY